MSIPLCLRVALPLLVGFASAVPAAEAQTCPACEQALVVAVGNTPFVGSATGCVIPADQSACAIASNNTSYFSFTPSESRAYRIKVASNEIDGTPTVLSLQSDCTPSSQIACTIGLAEGTFFPAIELIEGFEYRIGIGSSEAGADFIGSGVLTIQPVDPPGFGCSSATVAVLGTNAFDSTGLTEIVDLAGSCSPVPEEFDDAIYNTKYFRFTPATTGVYTISTCGQDKTLWERLAVLTGCTPADGVLACSDSACLSGSDPLGSSILGVELTAGVQYTILVGGTTVNDAGRSEFVISPLEPCPAPKPTRLEIEPCGQNINDLCFFAPDNAETIVVGDSVRGNYWASGNTRDVDIYRFEITQGTRVTLELNGTIPGFAVFVTPQCDVDYFADRTEGFCPALSAGACLPPGVHFVAVAPLFFNGFPCGYDGGNGYTLTLSGEPCDASPPPNDRCAVATTVFEGTTQADNLFADTELEQPTCALIGRDVWFKFTAPQAADYKFSTCGSAMFDTGIDIWTNCPDDNGQLIACNSDAFQPGCSPFLSALVVKLAGGQTAWIRIGSQVFVAGSFEAARFSLSITRLGSEIVCGDPDAGDCCFPSGQPSCNDIACCNLVCAFDPVCCAESWDLACAASAAICAGPCSAVPQNDDCTTPIAAAVGINDFRNTRATGTTETTCGTIYSDVFFSYTASTDEPVTISLCEKDGGSALISGGDSGDLDVRLAVFDGCGGSLIACNDDACGVQSKLTFTPTLGASYSIVIGSSSPDDDIYGQGIGAFALIVGEPGGGECVADLNGDGQVGAQDLAALLSAWDDDAGDLNGDGTTNAQDLAALLGAWGACGP
jgi:hypothetical protein